MVQEKDDLLRTRLLYIGSAVPLDTADGLEGVQKPLADRYPMDSDKKLEGILAYLSINKEGIQMQYDSDPNRVLFFPIGSLKLCAAVRCVTKADPANPEGKMSRFLSLSDPDAQGANAQRPAIFTYITRRSEGRKVLECHAFVCSCDKDALNLVACTSSVSRQYKERTNGVGLPSPDTQQPGKGTPASTVTPTPFPDHPIRLVAGGNSTTGRRVAPEFYDPPPQQGYYYKTADSQVKSYTIERVVDEGGSERITAISPNAPSTPRGPFVSERRPVYAAPPPHPQGFMTLPPPPPPQGRPIIPVRVGPPPHAPPGRPRFFSPPPPMLRPTPMPMHPRYAMGPEPYVLMPPGAFMEPPYVVVDQPPRRRKGSHSSHASSGSSSPGSPREVNGRQQQQQPVNGAAADGSTDAGSRPHTPPTDYEKGPRVSRKEQFERSQRPMRPVNLDPSMYGTLPGGPPPHHPYVYMMYPPRYMGYPPYMMERARSVPPDMNRSMYKDGKKSGKSKKDKKKKKKSGKHRSRGGAPSDVSTDSMGYTSEIGPGGEYPRMPRDFRRFENQFKHERAFSKSLKEEGSRVAPQDPDPANAYSLNEHMAKKGRESDFNLY